MNGERPKWLPEGRAPCWRDVEKLGTQSPLVQQCLAMYRYGHLDPFQSLMAMVLALAVALGRAEAALRDQALERPPGLVVTHCPCCHGRAHS